MNSDRYEVIKALLVEVVLLDSEERERRLREVAETDLELATEVRDLLDHEARFSSLEPTSSADTNLDPKLVGPYEIVGTLGQGGMGVVYHARQELPLQREVALKLIRRGMITEQALERFDLERRALARMNHPNIARVLDVGSDERGRPFFVMELVRGEPIAEFCDGARLGLRDRILLFLQIASAVQHAHQKGILHRDLKPSNVLVSLEEGTVPACKVIDFGIAKAIESGGEEDDQRGDATRESKWKTAVHQIIGTPEYMSPEQTGGGSADIDTRSDVYQLGVLLYELLAGVRPHDSERLRNLEYLEVLRIVRDEASPRPSERYAGLPADDRESIAATRATRTGNLERELRGDLDWILVRCLENQREQRYASVSDLSADLLRYLADEPVLAGPPTTGYRMRKFVRRHRGSVTAVIVTSLALVVGIAGTTWQAIRAGRQQARAERTLTEVGAFTNELLFDVYDAFRDLPGSTPARELFAQGTVEYLTQLGDEPEDASLLRQPLSVGFARLAKVQADLGNAEEAVASAKKSVGLAEAEFLANGRNAPARLELARRHDSSGKMFTSIGRIDESLSYHEEAVRLYEEYVRELPDEIEVQSELKSCRRNTAFLLLRMGRTQEALALSTAVLEAEKVFALNRPDDVKAQTSLALAYAFRSESLGELKRHEEALAGYESSAAILKADFLRDRANRTGALRYGVILGAVATEQMALDRNEAALETARTSLSVRAELAKNFPENRSAQMDLGRGLRLVGEILVSLSQSAEANEILEEAEGLARKLLAEDPENVGVERLLVGLSQEIAGLRLEEGQLAEALARLEDTESRNVRLIEFEPERSDHYWNRVHGCNLGGNVMVRSFSQRDRDVSAEEWQVARSWFVRAIATIDTMGVREIASELEDERRESERGIARCDSALAALRR